MSEGKEILKSKKEFAEALLDKRPVRSSLFAIWNGLNPSEQQFFLGGGEEPDSLEKIYLCLSGKTAIPLFDEFVKHTIIKSQNSHVKSKNIVYDANTNEIKQGENVISDSLTASEFKLLKFLMTQESKVFEKEEIINFVWGEQKTTLGVTDQALDQLIFRLRKKIENNPNQPTHILTIKGRGFKFAN